jgi:hypothetical protein
VVADAAAALPLLLRSFAMSSTVTQQQNQHRLVTPHIFNLSAC